MPIIGKNYQAQLMPGLVSTTTKHYTLLQCTLKDFTGTVKGARYNGINPPRQTDYFDITMDERSKCHKYIFTSSTALPILISQAYTTT